jgi:ubiquinone/menaquinone biosynthesis C-methylase UbiE
MSDEIERLKKLYGTKYNPDPQDRNYMWNPLNPVSIYFRQAQERAIANLLSRNYQSISRLHVLDIGCGGGGLLRFLASLGIPPGQLDGIDLMPYRIYAARQLAPIGTKLIVGNGENLPYSGKRFDLVAQSTVFSSIQTEELRRRIATEMIRVLQPGGHILWYDLYRSRNANLHTLPLSEIRDLFAGMEIRHLQRLHPIHITRMLRFGRLMTEIWENLPGVSKTHFLILLEKP